MKKAIDIDEIFGSTIKKSKEQIEEENLKLEEQLAKPRNTMDPEILRKLKEKKESKDLPFEEENIMPNVVSQKKVSIEIGVIGVGQGGSRIAEEFHKRGYDVGVINTSSQDLEYIKMLPAQKLLLSQGLGGTGKDLSLSREIFESNYDQVKEFSENILDGNDMAFLAVSGGGGSGSGSVDTMVNILFNTGMPVGVIYVLPKSTDDVQAKKNSIETLARLAKMTTENMISSLIVVDNARIENIYGDLSQAKFWETANSAIVDPIDLFNRLTAQPSKHTSLDPSDFGKVLSIGDCSVYGMVEVENYMHETALAESVIQSLNSNMLADGFDLKQTRVGGVIIVGSEKAINELPAVNIHYAFHMIAEETNGASVYQGIYTDESIGDVIRIYSWFSGLGLPQDRINNLQKEAKELSAVLQQKEKQRASSMTLQLEEDKTKSVTEQIHNKISQKNSGFNKLQRNSIIDKRRR
jgi:cell division GTPase FtsZ